MTAEVDGHVVANLDALETSTISGLSSPSSHPPSVQTDLYVSSPGFKVSLLNESVTGLGDDELPLGIDDLQLFHLYSDPWNGLGLADIDDLMLASDLGPHERYSEEEMKPVEDALGYKETHAPFENGFPSPLSLTQHTPVEVALTENPNLTPDLNFAAPFLLLDIGISEPTIPWSCHWSQESIAVSSTFSSQPSPKSRINSVSTISTTPHSPSMSPIICSWEECGKTFLTNAAFNHHLKYHTKPFHCPHCPLKHATKRLLHRHINERHFNTERYYCIVNGCSRSMDGDLGNGGRHFTREDNCKRHLTKMHGISHTGEGLGGEITKQAKDREKSGVVDMDELTRRIRRERKVGRRKMGKKC